MNFFTELLQVQLSQSKNGGVTVWEPGRAQKWLEVSFN